MRYLSFIILPMLLFCSDPKVGGKKADGARGEPGMYFITAVRNRMKDRINQGTWTLQLSGSKSTTAVPSTIGANPATGTNHSFTIRFHYSWKHFVSKTL